MTQPTRNVTVLLTQVSGTSAPRRLLKFVLTPLALLTASLALLDLPAPAHAGLVQVTFHESGFSDVTIVDQGSADLNPATNQILALVPASFFDYTGSVIVSSNNPGTGTLGTLNLNPNIQTTNTGPSPLFITAMQTGFSSPSASGSPVNFSSTLVASGLSGGSVSLMSEIDSAPTPLQTLVIPGTNVQSLTYVRGATYSLTAGSSITLTNNASSANYSATASASATVVPEPGSLVLLGLGIVGFAGYQWRKWKNALA
jgi:hypothetical protein